MIEAQLTREFLLFLAKAEDAMAKELGAHDHWDLVNNAHWRADGFRRLAAKIPAEKEPVE